MKVWIVPAGEAYEYRGNTRVPIELPAPLEVAAEYTRLVGSPRERRLSFRVGGRQVEVDVARCSLLTLSEDLRVVDDVEYVLS